MLHKEKIAIVAMGAVLPGANSLAEFWQNLRLGKTAMRTPPADRWILPSDKIVSASPEADSILSPLACFVEDWNCDVNDYNIGELAIEPSLLDRLDPLHHLTLRASLAAWKQANTESIDPRRTGVILGNIALPTQSISQLSEEVILPLIERQLFGESSHSTSEKKTDPLNRWVAGLPAAVVASALNIQGECFCLDAACASSLYAMKLAMDQLQSGRADMMITGGVSRPDSLYTQMGFSQLKALSPTGKCSPFDQNADGLVVGEGAGIFILKRLSDAMRDGDTILSTIASVGLSNDIAGNLFLPDSEGQVRAMKAAYRQAAWQVEQIDLLECHGTGTATGDRIEMNSMLQLFREDRSRTKPIPIGSVKSNIGHLLTAAGAASMIKVLMQMQHEEIAPTANFQQFPETFDHVQNRFTVLAQAEPWQRRSSEIPRRAAISAFGFGGINAHLLLEQYQPTTSNATTVRVPNDVSSLRREPPSQQNPKIAIIGIATHIGKYTDLTSFREQIFKGDQHRGHQSAEDLRIEELNIPLNQFRIPPSEIRQMLPQQSLMLQVAASAIEDAALSYSDKQLYNMGVFIGIELDINTTNFHFRWQMQNLTKKWIAQFGLEENDEAVKHWASQMIQAAGEPLTANRTMGALGGIVASRIARAFHIPGPSFTVSAEELSGIAALRIAIRMLQNQELNTALVGGVDLATDIRDQALRAEISKIDSQEIPTSDGAICLILKRLDDAHRDGDRIYATIDGFATIRSSKPNGGSPLQLLDSKTYQRAMQLAQQEAHVKANDVGLFHVNQSDQPHEKTAEIDALNTLSQHTDSKHSIVTTTTKTSLGIRSAATALASVATASLCLYHRIIPASSNYQNRKRDESSTSPRYWLRDRVDTNGIETKRIAMVNQASCTGSLSSLILSEVNTMAPGSIDHNTSQAITRHVIGEPQESLFILEAETSHALLEKLSLLENDIAENPNQSLWQYSNYWLQKNPSNNQLPLAATIIAGDRQQLSGLIAQLRTAINQNQTLSQSRVIYHPQPIPGNAKVAFVFPGSGNHYLGMGQQLATCWPEILERQDHENQRLASQFAQGKFWNPTEVDDISHTDAIFGQVCIGTMMGDLLATFGVKSDAIIGYSLGETAGLFTTRTWRNRDEMLQRMQSSSLFTHDLAGDCLAARKTWQLGDDEKVDWTLGVVNQSEERILQAIKQEQRVYLLIVNTPQECVIGGQRESVLQVVEQLGCQFHPIDRVTTVHCEIVKQVEQAYRKLHLFPTTPPAGVQFYSGTWGKAYAVDQNTAADSILLQALKPFHYTRVIESAYNDGIRFFLEMGPGNSCSRMIANILDQRPHVACSVIVDHQNEMFTLLRMLAELIAHRRAVDLSALFDHCSTKRFQQPVERGITIPVGSPNFTLPPLPLLAERREKTETYKENFTEKFNETTLNHQPSTQPNITQQIVYQHYLSQMAHTQAEESYLKFSQTSLETLAKLTSNFSEIGSLEITAPSIEQTVTANITSNTALQQLPTLIEKSSIEKPSTEQVFLDRQGCMEFAIGSIGNTLGPKYAAIDFHPSRVRLPDEPLMLVDRILEIEGQPLSLSSGRVVTEHDILAGAWYLDGGCIPTCIAVEAGQADLFLAGYLGIDFETHGHAVYRLLDAEVTFYRPLPPAGKTIRYDIKIHEFFRQGSTYLFRFEFDAYIGDPADNQLLLTMRKGCAGFFTEEELNAGQGVVLTTLDTRKIPGKKNQWQELLPLEIESYDDGQLDALRQGDLVGCFGEAFGNLPLIQPVGIPSGKMTLVHRILKLDPGGGRFGLGQIVGEADIHPDDWFLTCHFVDDQVMPGTLMYECCLHTLRVYLLRMGWVAEHDEVVYQPIPGISSQLKCRGQVISSTKKVQYELNIKEIGYRDEDGTPYVIADAMMSADGRRIVQMNNMSLQLTGLTKELVEQRWQIASHNIANFKPNQPLSDSSDTNSNITNTAATLYDRRPAIFNTEQIYSFAVGNPSNAFGDRYRVFDHERVIARLPGPPYQFLDRITNIENCQQWELTAGGQIEAQYDVPVDAWYFQQDRQSFMPFSILLEVALQPCGWLAAYLGSALVSEADLSFRNLGGQAKQFLPVTPKTGTLTTKIDITSVSNSGGMLIQKFDMQVSSSQGVVYQGDTYFGFFSKSALADQIGIRDAKRYQPSDSELAKAESLIYPTEAPFPDEMMQMVSQIDNYIADGGPHQLGYIRGTAKVDPAAWFFKAHFYQDPVWPGSLGLESFMQLLKYAAIQRFSGESTRPIAFESIALNQQHQWIYRGQILPTDDLVTIDAVITEVDDQQKMIRADGFLSVDGRVIYQMNGFTLKMLEL